MLKEDRKLHTVYEGNVTKERQVHFPEVPGELFCKKKLLNGENLLTEIRKGAIP